MKKIILLLVLSIFLFSACSRQNPEDLVGQGTPVPQQAPAVDEVVEDEDVGEMIVESSSNEEVIVEASPSEEVKEFQITAKQFSFEPSTIEVNKGDKVRLIVTSTDVPHGFSIKEYGINERLDVNKPVTIEFTADKQGTFTAFCSVFCGSGHSNMKGKMVVK